MRGLIALVLLLGGIASLVFGVGRLVGAIEGAPLGALVVGAILTLIGTRMVRGISGDDSEAPVHAPSSLGDHSLTMPTESEPVIPTASEPGTTRRPWIAVAIAVALAGLGAAVAAGMLAGSELERESPNVAQHIVDTCVEALRATDGPSASVGQVTSYVTAGAGLSILSFETSQGSTWECFYDVELGVATVTTE